MSAGPPDGRASGDRVRMTLRVSRDGGRTWGERRAVRVEEYVSGEHLHPSRYPPCACPRCAPRRRPPEHG